MPVTEAYMAPGDFRVRLRLQTPHLMETVREFGHIVILPQYPGHPAGFTDAELLNAARYTGVVLETEWANGRMTVYGTGLDWHLGEGNIGPRLEANYSFTGATLQAALTGMLPAVLTAGNIQNSGSYTGSHQDQTCKEAITALMRTLNAHYRINPNGSVDAELVGQGDIFVEDPKVVVVRTNIGSDALWTGVPSLELVSRRKGRDFASRALIGTEGAATRYNLSRNPYVGLNGQPLERAVLDPGAGLDSSERQNYAEGLLTDHAVISEEQIRLDQYEIVPVAGGSIVKPGDVVFVWDPQSGFYDTDNAPVWFRGECIAPAKLRVHEVEWPIAVGMGVYYRPSKQSVDSTEWVDLTPYVDWEATVNDAQSMLRVAHGEASTRGQDL